MSRSFCCQHIARPAPRRWDQDLIDDLPSRPLDVSVRLNVSFPALHLFDPRAAKRRQGTTDQSSIRRSSTVAARCQIPTDGQALTAFPQVHSSRLRDRLGQARTWPRSLDHPGACSTVAYLAI
jgi:hypothetical protein